MDLREPIRSVIPSLHGAVLRVLAGALRALSGADVARLLEGEASYRGVLYALDHLVEHGLVDREDHPPAALFRLNRDHLAFEPIRTLVGLRDLLVRRLADDVKGWPAPPTAVWLYGSFARGEGGPDSDLDVVVVRPTGDLDETAWDDQLTRLSRDLQRWTGNRASVVDYDLEELEAGARAESAVVRALLHETLKVAGPSPLELLSTPPRIGVRTRTCGRTEARGRLTKARAFLTTAQTVLGDLDDVAGANAVLAAIAAADALCCARLGRMSRSTNHADAVELVREVEPEGKAAATALERCLQVRNKAEYEARPLGHADATRAVRQAEALVDLAEGMFGVGPRTDGA